MKKYIGFLIVLSVLVFGTSQVKAIISNNLPVSDCISTTTPSITVLSPNGGEIYNAGQQITVKWKSCNFSPSISAGGIDIRISISAKLPSGENPVWALSQSSGGFSMNDGQELITLPIALENGTSLPYGQNFKIYVSRNDPSAQMPSLGDLSDNLFTINGTGGITSNTIIKKGTTGEEVKTIQNTLKSQGYFIGNATGYYGDVTAKAVSAYQKAKGLSVTGTVDVNTKSAIVPSISNTNSYQTITPTTVAPTTKTAVPPQTENLIVTAVAAKGKAWTIGQEPSTAQIGMFNIVYKVKNNSSVPIYIPTTENTQINWTGPITLKNISGNTASYGSSNSLSSDAPLTYDANNYVVGPGLEKTFSYSADVTVATSSSYRMEMSGILYKNENSTTYSTKNISLINTNYIYISN